MRHARDYYQTPLKLCDAWAELGKMLYAGGADIENKVRIIDLGAGDGRIGLTLSKHMPCTLHMYDVEPRADNVSAWDINAGQAPWPAGPKIIVSNPPFGIADLFLEYAHGAGPVLVSFLLPLSFLATQRRIEMWDCVGYPSRMDIIVPRPSFTGGGTDGREYALMWWGVTDKDKGIYRLEWK